MGEKVTDIEVTEDHGQVIRSNSKEVELGKQETMPDDITEDILPDWLVGVIVVIVLLVIALLVVVITTFIKNRKKNRSTIYGAPAACDDLESGKIGHSTDSSLVMMSFTAVPEIPTDTSFLGEPVLSADQDLWASTPGSVAYIHGVLGCRNPLFEDNDVDSDDSNNNDTDDTTGNNRNKYIQQINTNSNYINNASHSHFENGTLDHGRSKGVLNNYKRPSTATNLVNMSDCGTNDQLCDSKGAARQPIFAFKVKSEGTRDRTAVTLPNDNYTSREDVKENVLGEVKRHTDTDAGSVHDVHRHYDTDIRCVLDESRYSDTNVSLHEESRGHDTEVSCLHEESKQSDTDISFLHEESTDPDIEVSTLHKVPRHYETEVGCLHEESTDPDIEVSTLHKVPRHYETEVGCLREENRNPDIDDISVSNIQHDTEDKSAYCEHRLEKSNEMYKSNCYDEIKECSIEHLPKLTSKYSSKVGDNTSNIITELLNSDDEINVENTISNQIDFLRSENTPSINNMSSVSMSTSVSGGKIDTTPTPISPWCTSLIRGLETSDQTDQNIVEQKKNSSEDDRVSCDTTTSTIKDETTETEQAGDTEVPEMELDKSTSVVTMSDPGDEENKTLSEPCIQHMTSMKQSDKYSSTTSQDSDTFCDPATTTTSTMSRTDPADDSLIKEIMEARTDLFSINL